MMQEADRRGYIFDDMEVDKIRAMAQNQFCREAGRINDGKTLRASGEDERVRVSVITPASQCHY